jgi:hypothetical protein
MPVSALYVSTAGPKCSAKAQAGLILEEICDLTEPVTYANHLKP